MTTPKPVNLRCEYSEQPLGIDTPQPRFSWFLSHPERGQTQQSYQVIVSSDYKKIQKETGTEWDSGKVDSEKAVNITYKGAPLQSMATYYWRVRWWDAAGNISPFTDISGFGTAPLDKRDWTAQWITMKNPEIFTSKINMVIQGMDHKSPQCYAIYLRKEFEAKTAIKRGLAFVSGPGYYEFSINGQKAGDHLLDPAQTDYDKIALYASYDVTDLLKTGNNAIGLILGNGRHIKSYGYGNPRGIVQLSIEYENGEKDTIISDPYWKASHGPVMENGIYYGERYDARREMPGWDTADFNDAGWTQAEIVNGPALASQTMPPIRATDVMKPQKLTSPRAGVFIYDFGQNFTGWCRLFITGPSGTEVSLRFSETLTGDGMLNTDNLGGIEITDTYILKGEGEEVFEPRFTYHGFRYAEITGFPGIPTLENLEALFVHSDVNRTGNFHCSHQLINDIHRNILWGQLSNLMSVPTDCPQRGERMGWMGDAHLAAEESLYNFDMALFYTKYLSDIKLAQKDDGSLSDVIPPYWPLYPADPAWGSAYITIAWYCYIFYDDKRILDYHFDSMKKYIDFLSSNSENSIIKTLGRYGDWCPPGSILPKTSPPEFTSTWYYYHDTILLARIADVLDKKEIAGELNSLADEIKQAFNREYLIGSRYAAVDMGPLTPVFSSQTSQALPLYLDMVPEESREKALNLLLDAVIKQSDSHVNTGIIGTRYLFDVLTENGFAETAFTLATRRTYPGWGYMIDEGATTLWERWEKLEGGAMNSHNHIMFGSIDAWFYRTITGLSLLEPGWKKFRIKPYLLGSLTEATATIRTVSGEIHASWQKYDEGLVLFVSIPVGCKAEVYIPIPDKTASIFESRSLFWKAGKQEKKIDGVKPVKMIDNYVLLDVQSGFYKFKAAGGSP